MPGNIGREYREIRNDLFFFFDKPGQNVDEKRRNSMESYFGNVRNAIEFNGVGRNYKEKKEDIAAIAVGIDKILAP